MVRSRANSGSNAGNIAADTKSQSCTSLDKKINGSIDLLTKVDHLGMVSQALEEVKEKASALNSKQGQSISNSLSTLIKASEQLASAMKENVKRMARIGDLSYAHHWFLDQWTYDYIRMLRLS